jgi:hypothetical protein
VFIPFGPRLDDQTSRSKASGPTVALDLIDSIGEVVDLKSQGILSSFNKIDIDQRRVNAKVSLSILSGTYAED